MWEVADAYDGYALSRGIKKPSNAYSPEELAELAEWEEEEERKTNERIGLLNGDPR